MADSVLHVTANPAIICSFGAQRKHCSKKNPYSRVSITVCCQVPLLCPVVPKSASIAAIGVQPPPRAPVLPFPWSSSPSEAVSCSTRQLLCLSETQKVGQAQKVRDQWIYFHLDGCAQRYGEESKCHTFVSLPGAGQMQFSRKNTTGQ